MPLKEVADVSFDIKSLDLASLFADSAMFDSRRAWRSAGFDVFDPAKDTECMVAAHRSAPSCLFKKYPDDVSQRTQRDNFAARAEGARRVAEVIRKHDLRHIVVPQKHVHDLPRSFGKSTQVLIVERMDIVGREATEGLYHEASEEVLRELLRVLVAYPGLDSNSKNVQFTRGGKIAFVDLENYKRRDRSKVTLKSIGSYLSRDKLKLAHKILSDLKR